MKRHHKTIQDGYFRRPIFSECNGYLTDESEYESDEYEGSNELVDLNKITNFKDSFNYISSIVNHNECSFNYSEEVNLLPECLNKDGLSINRHYQFEVFKILAIKLSPIMSKDLSNITTSIFEFIFNTNVYWSMHPRLGYLYSNLPYYADCKFYMFNELWPNPPIELRLESTLSDVISLFDNDTCLEDENLKIEFKSFLQPVNKLVDDNMYLLKLDDGRFYRNSIGYAAFGVPFGAPFGAPSIPSKP